MSGHPKHLDAIHRRERAQELFKRAQDLAWMGHLPECLNVVEEGLLLHGGCKELLTLKAEVEPRLAALEEALEKAALRAAKRRTLKDAKRELMKLADAASVLGVAADCRDEAVLKRAFKKESLRHHPDRNRGDGDATRRFQLVNDAYEKFCAAVLEGGGPVAAEAPYDAAAAAAAFKAHLEASEVGSWEAFADVHRRLQRDAATLAVRTVGERKQAFAEYQNARKKVELREERALEKAAAQRHRQAFLGLLAEQTWVTEKTPWRDAAPQIKEHCRAFKDARWANVPDDAEKERVFDDFLRELAASEQAAKEARSKRRAEKFADYLADLGDARILSGAPPDLDSWEHLRWSKVDDVLRGLGDDRYKCLSSDSRKREFEAFRLAKVAALGGPSEAFKERKASSSSRQRSRSRDRSRRDDRDRSRRSRDRDRDRDRRGGDRRRA